MPVPGLSPTFPPKAVAAAPKPPNVPEVGALGAAPKVVEVFVPNAPVAGFCPKRLPPELPNPPPVLLLAPPNPPKPVPVDVVAFVLPKSPPPVLVVGAPKAGLAAPKALVVFVEPKPAKKKLVSDM